MRPRLVIIGNGLAGTRALEELHAVAPGRFDVTVIGDEPHAPYDRIQLSSVLAGEKDRAAITVHDRAWYDEHDVRFLAGCRVARIDRAAKLLWCEDGGTVTYDVLLLATGSRSLVLPLPGVHLPGVVGFRTLEDVEAMIAAADGGGRAVVIGGGLLGLEAAHGLIARGMHVTVVHLMDTLMERQLDPVAGEMLEACLRDRDFDFRLGTKTTAIVGDGAVEGVAFDDGETIPADLVVLAVGIVPNKELAATAGLDCRRGIVVDDVLRTTDPAIFALGECAEHAGVTYGLVAPLYEMARVWARHLAGQEAAYRGSITATRLKVAGVDVFSGGNFAPDPEADEIVIHDKGRGVYKRIVLRDDKVDGLVLFGDTDDAPWYTQLLKSREDVSALRDDLIFGQALATRGGSEQAAPLSDATEICGCNGVCKKTIVDAIRQKGLTSLLDVRAHTKASSSCGSCTPLVERVMRETLGDAVQAVPTAELLCRCTDLTHDQVRAAIVEQRLHTIPDVMRALGWKNDEGCATCRPALNYYLLAAWPGTYVDDGRSRAVNERVHANIQRDGTYSVIPRIWGGVAKPSELRAIAEIAERHGVREVKITGGQRLGLYGIRKEVLPEVWRELGDAGLVSGHAYGKALRTVKTCVGSAWCRFGVQDSTALGIRLEELLWGAWAPHKVKLGVSGCPRNCAEATIKDFGVVAVDSGWEIHVAGNGGMKVRAADLLVKVATAEEVTEYAAAFFQLYREEGRYGKERTAHWIERVGLDHLKQRLVEDADGRRALADRFYLSQAHGQKDPWAEHAAPEVANRDFAPLKVLA